MPNPPHHGPSVALPPLLDAAEHWFAIEQHRPDLKLITEPHVDEFLRANLWLVRGTDSSLLIDCGLGIVPIAPRIAELTGGPCPVVLTHGHLDHAGAAHEFSEVWGHEADETRSERRLSLRTADHAADLGLSQAGLSAGGDWLVSRIPAENWDPRRYLQRPAPLTRRLVDGDCIDLGGIRLEVLHLPGHTPGSLALYDRRRGELFSGDVIYDDDLLDSLPESDITAYRRSLRRIRSLPIRRVLPGHGSPFDRLRLHEIIDAYLILTA